METAKAKIEACVSGYKNLFRTEYDMFIRSYRPKALLKQESNKFQEVIGGDIVERHLLEYPEVLHGMIKSQLTGDEMEWFRSKIGARWFGNTYKEFLATKSV